MENKPEFMPLTGYLEMMARASEHLANLLRALPISVATAKAWDSPTLNRFRR